MALGIAQVAAVIKSALGHLSESGGLRKIGAIRDAVAGRLGLTSESDRLSAMSHVQSAKRIWEAGGELEDSTAPNLPRSGLPLDRSLNPGDGRFGYRVLVHVTDPETISTYTSMQTVYSDAPLSPAEIRSRAFQQWEGNRYDIDTDPSRFSVGARVNIEAQIYTAGRTN